MWRNFFWKKWKAAKSKNGNLEINRGGKFPKFPNFFGKEPPGVIFKNLEEFDKGIEENML